MKNKFLLILFYFSFIAFNGFSQSSAIDSLEILLKRNTESRNKFHITNYDKRDTLRVKILIAFSSELLNKRRDDESNKYSLEAEKISKKIGYLLGEAEANNLLGNYYFCQNNFEEAIKRFKAFVIIIEKLGYNLRAAHSYNNLGTLSDREGNHPEALNYFFKALRIAEKLKDKYLMASVYNNIGITYDEIGKLHEALKNYLQALKLFKEVEEKKEYTKSLAKFELVLEDDFKSNELKNIVETYNNIGACYLGLNQLARAEYFLNKAFDIREKINDKNGLRNSYTDLADLHIKNKEYKVALLYLKRAEELAKRAQNFEAQVSVYNTFINFYKAQNDYKKVLIYTELKVDILQKISNSENSVKLKELEAQAQARQKAAETEVSAEKQKNELTTRVLVITIVLIVLLVLVFLSYSVYNFRKNNAILRSNKAALTLKNEVLIKQNEEILRNQELAKQAVVAKASFIRNISHEVRTPLNAINGVADLISQDNLNQQQIDNIQILKKSTYKLINLINDILDFNNLESGNIDFTSTNFKIQQIINNLNNLFADKIKDKGLEFIINNLVDPKLVFKSDSGRISQVLANLLSNSLTFTDQGYIKLTIKTIESSYVKALVRFEVQDSGTGIDKDKLNTIFEAFTQIDASNTRKIEGAGLGLSISKKIVEGFNSQLQVRTVRGKGSTFYFDVSLNLADKETCDSNEDVIIKNITSLQSKNILIVEDSMVNVIILKQFLKKWGCTFTSVENGLEGLKAVKEQLFDLVLMDLQMPEMDGITCTKEIRALTDIYYKTLPIIALTAANENTMRDAAYAVGMNDYILKPFEPKNLQEKMMKAINESLA